MSSCGFRKTDEEIIVAQSLHGVLPIVQTPFCEDESIDFAVLHREVDWALEHGADGLGTGMVSEILRLTTEERIALTRELAEATAGRAPIFMAVSAESSKQAVAYALEAEKSRYDAVMAAPPVSTRVREIELIEYYCRIADSVSLPVIVQDASSYVGQMIPLAVSISLLEKFGEAKIFFKPEASPVGPNISLLMSKSEGKARIFEGSGGILLVDSFRRGVVGTMPGMEVVDGVAAAWSALEAGDEETAYRYYFPLAALTALQMQAGLDGFLAIEKHILVKRGVFSRADRRRPYQWELDDPTAAEVDRLVQRFIEPLQIGRNRIASQ